MKEFKGTKGKMYVDYKYNTVVTALEEIAHIDSHLHSQEALHYATLFSASEDLLEALQLLLMDMEERGRNMEGDAVKIAKQAINKALGYESN